MYLEKELTTESRAAKLLRVLEEVSEQAPSLKVLTEQASSALQKSQFTDKQKIEKLNQSYRSQRLVLVLGAGVSRDHGLPDWETLLQKLLLRTLSNVEQQIEPKKNVVFSKLFDKLFGPNPLIAARYIRLHFEKGTSSPSAKNYTFENAIRDIIYEELGNDNNSPLFKEIVELCASPGRSPCLDSVLTYNYDDLLEKHLNSLPIQVPIKSIYSIGMNAEHEELPIYHVHGYLPRTGNLTNKNSVTLSDDIYHQQYTDMYRWSNIIQLNKFKDYTCLFLGSSLTDPNQRRLLDIVKLQRGSDSIQHFIIKKRYKAEELEKQVVNILETNKDIFDEKVRAKLQLSETVKNLVTLVEEFEENDAHSFGVEVIWVKEHSDTPDILKQLKNIRK